MFKNVINLGAGKFVSKGEWKHPSRINQSYEMIVVTKGEVYLNKGGIEYILQTNDVLLIEPEIRHFGYKTTTDTEFFWLHWSCDDYPMEHTPYFALENPYHITLYLRELMEAQMIGKSIEIQNCLTKLILLELSLNARHPKTNTIAEKIRAWIQANSNTPITTKEIANKFGYNADYINRLFKSSFKKTVKQYIDEERIRFIKMLMLNHSPPLKQVATLSGFPDYKYFLKFFKYHEGITPSEFYRQHAKQNINSR